MPTASELGLVKGDIVRCGRPVCANYKIEYCDPRGQYHEVGGTRLTGLDMNDGPRVEVLETDFRIPGHGCSYTRVKFIDRDFFNGAVHRNPGDETIIHDRYVGFIAPVQRGE